MATGKISQHFIESQRIAANIALECIKKLHEPNDNSCTYAMTGLLTELLNAIVDEGGQRVFAGAYVREKIALIEGTINE